MLLYIQWQSQLSSQPSTHSFHVRMSISNTSVKCSSYIYLYIMKELKMLFFRTIYSIMNSNRQENINRIMKQTPPPEFPSWPGGPVSHPDSSTTWSKQTQVTVSCCSHSTTIKKKQEKWIQHICYHLNKWYESLFQGLAGITRHTPCLRDLSK